MKELLVNLEEHASGILLLVFFALTIVFAIDRLARTFQWGRYRNLNAENDKGAYVFQEFFVNLINDFRHLLALLIIFAFIFMAFYAFQITGVFEEKLKAFQAVVASMGGIVGSVIGYYFGESAARKSFKKEHEGSSNDSFRENDEDPIVPVVDNPVPDND